MASVRYSIKHKGVRLIDSQDAWVRGKNGEMRLSSDYHFVGKLDAHIPNLLITATNNRKPTCKGDVSDLNGIAKGQIIDHFYDENGKRNKKTVAYFGVPKKGGDYGKTK